MNAEMSRLVFFVAVSHIIVSYVLDEIRRQIVKFNVVKRIGPDRHLHGGCMARFWQPVGGTPPWRKGSV